jgi:glutaryl-CoA dehydrogenase
MERLANLGRHLKPAETKKRQPTDDVWGSMGLDKYLRPEVVLKRQATRAMMQENYTRINEHINSTEFPFWIIPKIRELGINGGTIKGFGSAEMSDLEFGAIAFEMSKYDASLATFLIAQNGLGAATINACGDETQK